MRAALGNIRKTGEINRVRLVIHVALEHVIVPVFSRRSVLHVTLIIGEASSGRERSTEVGEPLVEIRMHHDVWRREDHVFLAFWKRRRKQPDVPVLVQLPSVARRNDSTVDGAGYEVFENAYGAF